MSYTKDNIPSFLRSAGADLVDTEQRIDTDILEPVIFTDTFLRFELQRKGLLNPKSRITFSLNAPSAEAFFPLGVGVGSLIQRATLRIGGKTICEVDDWSHYHAYKSMFVDQETNKQREQYNSARCMSNSVQYEDNTNTSTAIGMDLGREYTYNATASDTRMDLQPFQLLDNEPVFSITLDDLLPCLRGVQLPLFLFQEEIQVELTLAPLVGKRACFSDSGSGTKGASMTLDQNEVRMIADYTFLDGDAMDAYASANRDYEYTFLEPRLTRTTLATASDWTDQVRNVGGAGRRVPKMFVMLTSDKMGFVENGSGDLVNTAGNNQLTLLNDYRAIAPSTGSEVDGVFGKLTANIKKNDTFIYPIARSNSALHYHGVQQTEGSVPHITRTEYARQGNAMIDKEFMSRTLASEDELAGQFFVQAYRFPDGERVDSRGLEMHMKYSGFDTATVPLVQRCYIMIEKRFVVRDGIADSLFE